MKSHNHAGGNDSKSRLFSNLKLENSLPHLQRVLPPSHPIRRVNHIQVDSEKLRELLSVQLDPNDPGFENNLHEFLELMENIRLAVQSNLGLSAVERDAHETNHPILIKMGDPEFPIEEDGDVNPDEVLYASADLQVTSGKHTPKVKIIQDWSGNEGLSLLFQTKFRTFAMHISSDGRVESTLQLNWKEIYDDLAPEISDQQHALRSFTPWQRHSESNFFNGRSTSKVLTYLSKAYPLVFKYDSKCYYRDDNSESIDLDISNIGTIQANNSNLYVTLDHSLVGLESEINTITGQPILAVVRRKSPLMGNLIQLVPALYVDGKLHLVLHGHQEETEIEEIFSCDFKNEKLIPLHMKQRLILLNREQANLNAQPSWSGLHFLRHHPRKDLIKHTSAAPMVRASDAVMRKYWVSGFDVPTVYSEMITIADIFNTDSDVTDSPQERLEELYYSNSATSSFRRLNYSEYELEHASSLAFQVVAPHDSVNDGFYWGDNGENIARTTRMALKVMLKMVPEQFHHKLRLAVNMCCPASSIERMGGGFGLCKKPEYLEKIVQTIKEQYPELHVEFKTLMMSASDKGDVSPEQISFERNNNLRSTVKAAGADALVWQGKPRNQEAYNPQAVLEISRSAHPNDKLRFSYSGMVATLEDKHLSNLGYNEPGAPHYSVEGLLEEVRRAYDGKLPDGFEVMLGRALLGSPWLLMGRHASDHEIVLLSLLQSLLLREMALGAGPCGVDLMQIQILYNIRHISNEDLRNELMQLIFESRSALNMIDALYESCISQGQHHDIGAVSLLKPSILKLKVAIERAAPGYFNIYSDRESVLMATQASKRVI